MCAFGFKSDLWSWWDRYLDHHSHRSQRQDFILLDGYLHPLDCPCGRHSSTPTLICWIITSQTLNNDHTNPLTLALPGHHPSISKSRVLSFRGRSETECYRGGLGNTYKILYKRQIMVTLRQRKPKIEVRYSQLMSARMPYSSTRWMLSTWWGCYLLNSVRLVTHVHGISNPIHSMYPIYPSSSGSSRRSRFLWWRRNNYTQEFWEEWWCKWWSPLEWSIRGDGVILLINCLAREEKEERYLWEWSTCLETIMERDHIKGWPVSLDGSTDAYT